MQSHKPHVTHLQVQRQERTLIIQFANGSEGRLSFEFLRVHSPSAQQKALSKPVLHKKQINIKALEPVGHYAIKIIFDDGHDTGLYSWDYLYDLTQHQEALWQNYLKKVQVHQGSREALIPMHVSYSKKIIKKK